MAYSIKLISPAEKDARFEGLRGRGLTGRKANIHGVCVELLSDDEGFLRMWDKNFSLMAGDVVPHCSVVAFGGDGEFRVEYEPANNTAFLLDCGYYGYVKSIALSAAGDVLEERSISKSDSVHGSLVEIDGQGIAMIGPSGVGKTTHSYGLLLGRGGALIADDWFFVELGEEARAFASERRSYVREDIGEHWKEFSGLVEGAEKDNAGRAIVDIGEALGVSRVKKETVLERVILLKRDGEDNSVKRQLTAREALEYLEANDFCNPHLLVKNERKHKLRSEFFRALLSRSEVWMVNTNGPVKETQDAIREIVC